MLKPHNDTQSLPRLHQEKGFVDHSRYGVSCLLLLSEVELQIPWVILCQLIPGVPESWIQDLLVCSVYGIELCCSIGIASLLVWMLYQN